MVKVEMAPQILLTCLEVGTIEEETDDQIDDVVVVDAAPKDHLSEMTASENDMSSNNQVVSIEVGERNNVVTTLP